MTVRVQTYAIRNALPPALFAEVAELVNIPVVPGAPNEKATRAWTGWWGTATEPRCLADRVGKALYAYLEMLPGGSGACGAEWWVRVATTDDAHSWHLDKDEGRWDRPQGQRDLQQPLYGSVLYLSSEGGPTIVSDQTAVVSEDGQEILGFDPPQEEGAWIVGEFPEPNKFLIFPGHLRHGVGTSGQPGLRHTLLYNWWEERPLNMPDEPKRLPGEET